MNELEFSLTVLICVHSINNFHDSLLIESLKSLQNQTYTNFKTLIILDECWNETEKKIMSSRLNLDLSIYKKNKKTGLSDAKNYGISLIDTEWVAFLDADDLYTPTKLEEQIKFIKNNEVDFLGCHSWNINGANSDNLFPSCFDEKSFITHDEIINKLNNENVLTHGSMMIKKKCIIELDGYKNVSGSEDWDLWLRAINKGYKFYQLPIRLYVYRLYTSVPR